MLQYLVPSLLVVLSVLWLYLSNRHQVILTRPIASRFRVAGYVGMFLVPVILSLNHSVASSILLWLMIIMMTVITLPFVSLWLRR